MVKQENTTGNAVADVITGEVVENIKAPAILNESALGDLTDFGSALAALGDLGVTIEDVSDYGSGFAVAEKETLVGVPFIALQWRFSEGDYGPFVTVHLMTEDNRKLIINDGSTGIMQQFINITRKRLSENGNDVAKACSGLLARKGLTRSDYTYKDENGKPKSATTFYVTT